MFKGLRQSKEDKSLHNVETHLAAGLKQLSQKMNNGAMIEFDKAMVINASVVYPKLLKELEKQAESGELESAIAIGMNLIKAKKKDYVLMNKLGTFAQQLQDFKQAIALYKTALKIKKDYKPSFYNLAASEVKAQIFNEDAVNAISQFKDITDHILPSYLGGDGLIQEMTQKASAAKPGRVERNIRQLTLLHDKKAKAGELGDVKKIKARIEHVRNNAKHITTDDVCNELKKMAMDDPDHGKDHSFNLGLYAIANKKPDIAKEALQGLSSEDYPTLELLQSIIREQNGNLQEAIDMLVQILAQNEFNRLYNVNLGLMYRRANKQFLSVKYLIKTAMLLKKSDGIYSMRQLIVEANSCFNQGNYKKALKFYQIAVTEKPEPEIKNKIGIIFRKLKRVEDAINMFRDVLKTDPTSQTANEQLKKIHDSYIETGDSLLGENRYKPAAEYYDRALSILRLPKSLRKAAQCYRQLNNIKTEKQLLVEAEAIENAEKETEQERLRQALVIKGKKLLGAQQYQKAIEVIEAAFMMKIDRKVYMQLAALYKKFKGKDSLAGLEKRWSDMVIQKDRDDARAKEKEHEQQAQVEEQGAPAIS